jgi:hypothetical protein
MLVGCGPESVEVGEEVVGGGDEAQELALRSKDARPASLALHGPAVAYGGGKYFAVWNDVRTGGVYGTRVRQNGTVLEPEGLRINIGDESGGRPDIAYNGTHFFVVWETRDGIDGVRVSPDGTVVGPVFRVLQSDESLGQVRIACSEWVCLVVTTVSGDDETAIYFTRVTSDGVVLDDPDQFLSPGYNYARSPSVAWNNSRKQFLVVWSDERGGGQGQEDIYGNRVTEIGTILDGDGFPISEAPGAQETPDVAWSGRRYHVVWSDRRDRDDADIYGARVRPNGTVEDADGIAISTARGDQTVPRVAHHNSKSLVVWDDTRSGWHAIWGARLGEDGDVWDPRGFPISRWDAPAEFLPDVAYGADRFFTVYAAGEEPSATTPHAILGTRVNHQAQVKDTPALPLTQEP